MAVTRPKDVWILGRHRLLCGNALEPSHFATLLGEERADLIFTDPPYNVPIDGNVGGLGSIHHRDFAFASGEMTSAEFTVFLGTAFKNMGVFSGGMKFPSKLSTRKEPQKSCA